MEKHDKDELEIDLGSLIRELLRKWWAFLIVGGICGLLALIGTIVLITPQYESQSMLYVLSKTADVTSYSDFQISTELTADFGIIATSAPVFDGAAEKIEQEEGIKITGKEIEEMVEVSDTTDSRILVIKARNSDPMTACSVANAVAEVTADQMAYITQSDPPTIVEEAEVSDKPVSPNIRRNLVLGVMAGFLLVGLYLVICYLRDDSIKNQEDVERYLGLHTLAVIPLQTGADKRRIKAKNKKQRRRVHE
ncbi:MAG: YveK family protein [Ruminococcus sp.]